MRACLCISLLALGGCGAFSSSSNANRCPATDDAGIFAGTLYTLDDAGNLTVNFDAGNGGVDLGPVNLDGGGIGHVYEWPCVGTYDCQTPRDASITFVSPNGVSNWKPLSMNYGNGADCVQPVSPTPDAGTACCKSCGVGWQPCGNTCISVYEQCTIGLGCACP